MQKLNQWIMCDDIAMPANGLQGADMIPMSGRMHALMEMSDGFFLDSQGVLQLWWKAT